MAQHSNSCFLADESIVGFCGIACNASQLCGVGVLVQRTVSEQQDTVIAILRCLCNHDEERGYQLCAGCSFQDLQRGSQCICCGMDCAGNHTVCNTHLNQHNCNKQGIIHQDFSCFFQCHAFALSCFCKTCNHFVHSVVGFGVYENCLRNIKGAGSLHDFILLTNQNDICQFFLQAFSRCLQVSFFIGLGQNDYLLFCLCFCFHCA